MNVPCLSETAVHRSANSRRTFSGIAAGTGTPSNSSNDSLDSTSLPVELNGCCRFDRGRAASRVKAPCHGQRQRYEDDSGDVEQADRDRIGLEQERFGANQRHELEVLLKERNPEPQEKADSCPQHANEQTL